MTKFLFEIECLEKNCTYKDNSDNCIKCLRNVLINDVSINISSIWNETIDD